MSTQTMSKLSILILLVLCTQFGCTQSTDESLLNGVWHIVPNNEINPSVIREKEYGWGKGITLINDATEIDLVNRKFYIPGLFLMDIVRVVCIQKNVYEIVCYFKNGDFNVSYIVHFLDKNRMWMEYKGEGALYNSIGPGTIYYRLGTQK